MGVDKGCESSCLDAFWSPIKVQRQYAQDFDAHKVWPPGAWSIRDKMVTVSNALYSMSNGIIRRGFCAIIRSRGSLWIATQKTTPKQSASYQNGKEKGNVIPGQVLSFM